MANEEHLAILRQGVEVWNQWRGKSGGVEPDLSGAKLDEANLEGVNLYGTNLKKANLYGADLRQANLEEANLEEANLDWTKLYRARIEGARLERAGLEGSTLIQANLSRTNLIEANLARAVLIQANLARAVLIQANLEEASLSRANFEGANLSGASFAQSLFNRTMLAAVDLREVRGLDTVVHRGPSTIGLDTIELSQGQIPESFLRGCGVSDRLIEYIPSLTAQPIQYYSCFISYSSQDEALAKRLHADLQAHNVRCWFAPHDLKIGQSIIDGIDQGIRLHEKLLLILSESSVASRWVGTEVKTALMREHTEGRTVLFPIRLDDAVLQSTTGWAGQVQERHIGDFCKWKDHDAYQAAFARLLRDLRAG